jgi:selenocysteine lyase/cysteine desulfurase
MSTTPNKSAHLESEQQQQQGSGIKKMERPPLFRKQFSNRSQRILSSLLKPFSPNKAQYERKALLRLQHQQQDEAGEEDKAAISLDDLRSEIIGIDAMFTSPFGKRLITYADYTASGRCLKFIEDYMQREILPRYANTHTEDVFTGSFMTRTLHEAEVKIKKALNAGLDGRIISCGTGSTWAINKFQQLIGVFIPPATRSLYEQHLKGLLGEEGFESFTTSFAKSQPVVFVGPYEHHSNEVTWRQGFATVVEVGLARDGTIDLEHLERLLKDEAYLGRLRIGSFSAASNVTGVRTYTKKIAKLLHDYGAYACFDFAASAPYVDIDMSGDDGTHFDAVYISPHKFLGGPGSAGILVFNEKLYHSDLPPTVAGGGTVQYVSANDQDFIADTEEREKAGTPGALQTLRAALAIDLKSAIGVKQIEKREHQYLKMAFDKWLKHENIEILGPLDVNQRISIVSFNVVDHERKWLHPKFVAKLLNDLFGVQSRAGCSCAGPYGHLLLNIDACQSEKLRGHIKEGFQGLKLGWCRIGFHFAMDEAEVNFIINAVLFVADFGSLFVPLYDFDVTTGSWNFKTSSSSLISIDRDSLGIEEPKFFSIHTAWRLKEASVINHKKVEMTMTLEDRVRLYEKYFAQAKSHVKALQKTVPVIAKLLEATTSSKRFTVEENTNNLNNASADPMVFASSYFRI